MTDELATRRALRDWAVDKPEHIRGLANTIRHQLRILGTFGNAPGGDTLRGIVADNIKRLAAETPR